jgi:hypothetical protein
MNCGKPIIEHRPSAARVLNFVTAVLVVGVCASAIAAPDTFDRGDGHTGAVTLSVSGPVNWYTALSSSANQGDNSLGVVNATGFAAGDLVMIVQTTGLVPSPPSGNGSEGPVDVSTDPVGAYEFARLANVDVGNGTLELTQPLVNQFTDGVSQVIRVPEYTDLTINSGVTITAQPWDGLTGGVIVFFASGTVNNSGIISASNQGFRGGVFHNGATRNGCADLDQAPYDGAEKGEGIQADRYGPTGSSVTGYGVVSNGAGGGVCRNSGGGGGGNAGSGGNGGFTWIGEPGGPRDVGGRGGRALLYSQFDHLSLGGGGGAAHGEHSAGTGGAAGGGAIYIRASTLFGSGSILANGQSAADTSGNDAAGGGGAGGTISLRITGSLSCGTTSARGGNGGSVTYSCPGCQTEYGPGGGGGGGRILLQAANIQASPTDCRSNVTSGVAGTTVLSTTLDPNYGATPSASGGSYDGIVTIPPGGGFVSPLPAPVITTPVNGSLTNNPQPPISGTEAQPGSTVVVFIDGALACTSAVAAGSWSCTGPSLLDGPHTAVAIARYQGTESLPSNSVTFTVRTGPPAPPVITAPVNNSFTNNTRPTISGTAEASSTVAVTDSNGRPVCSGTTSAAGSWSCSPSSALADGTYTIRAIATDGFNTSSPPSAPVTFTVKTTLPPAPVITTPTNNAIINNDRPPIGGTAEPFSTVAVRTSTGVALCTGTASSTGAWTCTPPGLTDGAYTVTARATDRASNTGPASTPVSFTIDSPAPAGPVIARPANGTMVYTSRPSLSGTAAPGLTIQVSVDGVLACSTTSDTSGSWLCLPNTPLTDGSHTATATATSASGKTSPASPSVTFLVNTHAPNAPTIAEPTDGSRTSNNSPRLAGTAEPGANVSTSIDGAPACTASADADGNWSCSPPLSLTNGLHTVSARASNTNGSSPSTASQFTVDPMFGHPLEYRGGGFGCSSTGETSSLSALLLVLASVLLARKRLATRG